MALFQETSEVQAFIPVIGTTAIESMLPFINQAERDYIIPYISKAQYDALNDAYNATPSTLTTEQTALLKKVQAALSQYFFYLWIPSAQLHIGPNGIRIATTESLKTAFQWQIDELRTNVLKAAGSAMDDLLYFMETNKADYPLWTASTSYTLFKECFITSTTQFTELYSPLGNSRLNFIMIRSSMKKAQEFSIQSLIGFAYYDELKTEHLAGSVSAENALVITYIQKALAPLTMLRAITELSVSIDERGILNFNGISGLQAINQKQPAKDSMIFKLEKAADEDSKAYMQMLKDFLQTNIANYPTYAASTSYNSETTNTTFENKSDNNFYFAG
jgi:hypothetical protein